MKRLLFSLALVASSALAEPVSLVFDQVSVIDLARVALGEIAKEQVLFTHEALSVTDTVTLSLKGVDKVKAIRQVEQLLKASGLEADRVDGVTWVKKAKPEEGEFFYRPRNRAVSYLVDMLSPLFKQGAFTLQRGLNSQPILNQYAPQGVGVQATPAAIQGQGAVQSPAPVDSGTSAYSMLDKNPDAFMFKGSQRDIERLKALLDQVDSPTPELLVRAVVFEVSTSESEQSALGLAASILGGKLGLSVGKASAGDYSAVFNGSSLQLVYDALSKDSRFKVVSAPTLRVRSGASARLTVGNQTPVLGAVQYDANGRAVQSVEYKPSGVILDIKPQIREETADLQINQQISSFIATTTGVNSSPTLVTREVSTSVGVKSGELLFLGGLDQNEASQDSKGLSFLPGWMKARGESKAKTEVLLVLQATRI